MRQRAFHIVALASIILGASSCAKIVNTPDHQGELIQFSSSESTTKALDSNNINAEGNKFLVYDVLSKESVSSVHYILDQEIAAPGTAGSAWEYNGGNAPYYWLVGTHKLFGYNTYDKSTEKSISDLFESEEGHKPVYSSTDKKLYLPEIKLTEDSPQFDMLYSNIVTRKITDEGGDTSIVPLECSHLFGRFLITAQNISASTPTITLNSLYIQGLKTKASATIDFSGDETVATINGLAPEYKDQTFCDVKNNGGSGYTLTQGAAATEIIPDRLMWPQTLLTDKTPPSVDEATGDPVFDKEDILIIVNYTIAGMTSTRAIRFPNAQTGIEAGKVHQINILFSDKLIKATLDVLPWTDVIDEISYDNEIAATTAGALSVVETTCIYDDVNHIARFLDTGEDIVFRFHLDKPAGGRWMVSLTGAFDYFTITQGAYGTVGESAEVHVNALPQANNVSCQLHISVMKPSGEVISADEVLQKDYKITIKK